MQNLRLVIDTNIFLVALSPKGKYHWVYQLIRTKKIHLLISNEILSEYSEICGQCYLINLIEELIDALFNFSNVFLITPTFRWNVKHYDPDDNKFVDCDMAGNADYILSNDRDFDVLKRLDFPKITVLTLNEFETLFREQLTHDS